MSLHLNLRRQIFIAVCDDLILRDRLATQLQTEFTPASVNSSPVYPHLVGLQLNLEDPNPLLQIAQWLTQSPPPIVDGYQAAIPAFQVLGIEHLTRQSSAIQRLFFTHLQTIEQNLPLLDFSILLWVTQPWFHALPNSAPEFWHCRTGVFEFIGDPTPLTITSPERFGAQSSQQYSSQQYPAQQTIASAWTAPPLDRAAKSLSATDIQGKPATESGEDSWLTLSPELRDGQDETSSPAAGLPLEATGEPIAIDATLLPLIADELEEGSETEGLTQAEISTLLGEIQSVSLADKTADEMNTVAVAMLPADTEVAPENPWLALAEGLTQLYEIPEVAEVTQEPQTQKPQTQEPQTQEQTAIELDQQPQSPSTVLEPEVEEERSIPFVPIQLPQGLAQREQLESILLKIEQLHQQQAPVSVLVDAYRSVGNLFRDRIEQGQVTPQNLIVAIQAYERALLGLSEVSPLWVDVLNDLGNLYWMASRTTPNSEEALSCLNQAIQAYQFALSKIDPQTHAYPMVQNNLGAAYADLARHDNPTENLELSVQSYRQALHYRKPEIDPLRYASTQNNLGTTYWNLAQYKAATENLKLAIASYIDALQYYNPAEEALNYAMIQNNLGTAYWNLAQHDRSQDWLTSAVSAYRAALEYRTLEANPVAHAATQNNLGTAYWHIANETEHAQARIDYLQQAIESYEAALQAVKHLQTHQPHAFALLNFDAFATHNNLGLAYYQVATDGLSSLDSAKQSTYLQSGLDHHVVAWQGWVDKPNLRQTAFSCIVQTIQAAYNQLGLSGQSAALSRVPGELLPEILPKL